jgi:hypothetical protein
MPTAVTSTACPSCSAPASGQFCASCGASLSGATCAGCRASLTPGARFCHRCGTPAGSRPPEGARTGRDPLPWAVALISLCALIALVGGQRFAAARGAGLDAPQNALPQAGLDFPASDQAGMRAPDISAMSPRERANRLYNRIMVLHEQGKTDSVQFIAINMFIPQLRSMEPLDAHLRYDLGRVGEVAGTADVATAQADTILREQPNHLLGLILASRAARMRGDETAALAFDRKALAVESAERAKQLEEYAAHDEDIKTALAEARRVVK